MKERVYRIAGIVLKVVSSRINALPLLSPFLIEEFSQIDMEILIQFKDTLAKPKGILLVDQNVKWVSNPKEYYCTSIYSCTEDNDEIICRADANQDWSRAVITYSGNKNYCIGMYEGLSFLCEIVFRNRALFKQGIAIHAAAISWEGKGIAFTAPSGTGKSTQAELWVHHMHAIVINDDRPILKMENKKTYVHGTPWGGKKGLFRNECAPLTAIIVLEQAAENQIERLHVSTAVAKVLPRCFLPYYDRQIMSMCLKNFGDMLPQIPVFELKCQPNRESVELVRQCLETL